MRRIYVYIGLSISCTIFFQAEQLVILTFRPYPIIHDTPSAQAFANHLRQPGKSGYNTLRTFFENEDSISGIFCTYGGFIVVSDWYGQAIFPKIQTQADFYLLITPKLIPIPLIGNTIHHWELEKDTSADLFVVERTHNPTTDDFVWNVERADISSTFAHGQEVPINTIVLFGEPKYFFVPTGSTLQQGELTPHFFLPSIYVKKGIPHVENALYVLNLKYLFRKPLMLYQQAPHGYSTLLYSQ